MGNNARPTLPVVRRLARSLVRGFPDSTAKHFLGKEWTSSLRISPVRRAMLFPRCWRHGLLTDAHFLYDERGIARGEYLSDYARLRTKYINGEFSGILHNKIAFAAIAGRFLPTPTNLAAIVRGRVYPLAFGERDVNGSESPVWLRRDVAIKPVASGAGVGVHILRWDEGKPILDGCVTTEEAVAAFIQRLDACIITDFVQQSSYSAAFHPPTTNTIRILTMIDPESGEPFIAIAVQRMGSSSSMPVDNWSQGGICAEIDLDTGALSRGVSFPCDGVLRWHDAHPETNQAIKGVSVPRWPTIRDTILYTARQLSYLQYVGWDVVVTDDGMRVLEGNNHSDVNLLQVHRPLLADPRVRAFYRHHGVIRR